MQQKMRWKHGNIQEWGEGRDGDGGMYSTKTHESNSCKKQMVHIQESKQIKKVIISWLNK